MEPAVAAPEPSVPNKVLVLLSVLIFCTFAALSLMVLVDPVVNRFQGAFATAGVAVVGMLSLVARRPEARMVVRRWLVPVVALGLGLPYIAIRLTWSYPDWGLILLPFLLVAGVGHLVLLVVAVARLDSTPLVAVATIIAIAATWLSLFGVPEDAARDIRVSLASDGLEVEANALLAAPQPSGPHGPFVLTNDRAQRAVGWQIGSGFLGRGEGLIWDPDGILARRGRAQTRDGYPWFLDARFCEQVIDDWIYCSMR